MKLTSDQIVHLLIEKITGTIAPEDNRLIEQLLQYDKDTIRRWQILKQQIALAEEKGFQRQADVDAGWAQLKSGMTRREKPRIVWYQRVSVAAALIAIILSGFYFWTYSKNILLPGSHSIASVDEDRISLRNEQGAIVYVDPDSTSVYQQGNARFLNEKGSLSYRAHRTAVPDWHILSVPRVLNYHITLPDGTAVYMNSRTSLRFPDQFSGNTREVYLDGEAYFEVAKNATLPFIVHARNTAVRVLGTSFNLNTYDTSAIKTSLVEGSVLASASGKSVKLRPGFEAINKDRGNSFSVVSFDAAEVLSWMKGVYHFHNASLGELAMLLSRWYKVQVVFQNPLLRKKTFSGEISRNQPVEFFLDNLKISNGIDLGFEHGTVIFR